MQAYNLYNCTTTNCATSPRSCPQGFSAHARCSRTITTCSRFKFPPYTPLSLSSSQAPFGRVFRFFFLCTVALHVAPLAGVGEGEVAFQRGLLASPHSAFPTALSRSLSLSLSAKLAGLANLAVPAPRRSTRRQRLRTFPESSSLGRPFSAVSKRCLPSTRHLLPFQPVLSVSVPS